jgi:hypothetical protein
VFLGNENGSSVEQIRGKLHADQGSVLGGQDGKTNGTRRYAAFISYSHADAEMSNWLQKRLESSASPS